MATAMFVTVTANAAMAISLYSHQQKAIEELRTGSILCGGVGTGKSRVSLSYFVKTCDPELRDDIWRFNKPKDLYIITTARKRDTLEWDKECLYFRLSTKRELSLDNVLVTIDSWNNIAKYIDVKDAFFIFDEQRVVGSGSWVKSFLKITKSNDWILLSATPGDTWMDYIPVFIANGYFKNRTEFIRNHVVYNRFTKYPKVDRFVGVGKLILIKEDILVNMHYEKHTVPHVKSIFLDYDRELMDCVMKKRWNPFKDEPIKDISELCYTARRVVNSDLHKIDEVKKILDEKKKVIIFYNFDYELEILRTLSNLEVVELAEWNGHNHEPVPQSDKWVYLVQYTAGAEGWNCIETDTIIFYSPNYSYKVMLQSSGRIDRLNTPFSDLYYYVIATNAQIDKSIFKALKCKKTFNESNFV